MYSTKEYSFDELGLLDMSCAFTASYWSGGVAVAAIIITLRRSRAMHELQWLLVGSYAFFAMAHLFYLINYVQYSRDGQGYEGCAGRPDLPPPPAFLHRGSGACEQWAPRFRPARDRRSRAPGRTRSRRSGPRACAPTSPQSGWPAMGPDSAEGSGGEKGGVRERGKGRSGRGRCAGSVDVSFGIIGMWLACASLITGYYGQVEIGRASCRERVCQYV